MLLLLLACCSLSFSLSLSISVSVPQSVSVCLSFSFFLSLSLFVSLSLINFLSLFPFYLSQSEISDFFCKTETIITHKHTNLDLKRLTLDLICYLTKQRVVQTRIE